MLHSVPAQRPRPSPHSCLFQEAHEVSESERECIWLWQARGLADEAWSAEWAPQLLLFLSFSFSSLSFAASVSLHLWIFHSLNSFYSTSGGAFTTSKPRESVSPSPNTLIQHPSTDWMNNPASSHSNLYSNQTGAQNLPAAKDTASLVMLLSHGRHDSWPWKFRGSAKEKRKKKKKCLITGDEQ